MTIAWTRGLFRIWALASVVWIVFTLSLGIFTYATLPTAEEFFGCNTTPRLHYCGQPPAPDTRTFEERVAWQAGYFTSFMVQRYLLWMIIPPAVLFALGYGARWAALGFRSSPSAADANAKNAPPAP